MGVERCAEPEAITPPDQETHSRAVKILQPNLVLATVVVLAACAVAGLAAGASTFESPGWHSMSVVAAQAGILTSSFCSIPYIIVHLVAAYRNDACGVARPPLLKLHGACFIIARIDFVLWMMTIILSSVALSRNEVCPTRGPDCRSAIIGVTISSVAFIATGIVLSALEACQYPFQPPYILGIQKTPPSRPRDPYRNNAMPASQFQRQEMRNNISNKGQSSTSMDSERSLTPLLLTIEATRAPSWGEEWEHLARRTTKRSMTISDSGVSGLSRSSSGYMSTSTESSSVSRGRTQPKVVTPSSSIRNMNRRSPLSTVRSADRPEVAVRPELRYCPPKMPAPHERILSRASSLPQLLPVAEIQRLQRRSSIAAKPCPIRRPTLPPLVHQRLERNRSGYMIKRQTSNSRVSIGYRLSIDQERQLGEHAKNIVTLARLKSQSDRNSKPRPLGKSKSTKLPEKKNLPTWNPFHQDIDSRARYREQRPVPMARSRTTKGSRELRALTSNPSDGHQRDIPKIAPLRKLSLGDISSGFEGIF